MKLWTIFQGLTTQDEQEELHHFLSEHITNFAVESDSELKALCEAIASFVYWTNTKDADIDFDVNLAKSYIDGHLVWLRSSMKKENQRKEV